MRAKDIGVEKRGCALSRQDSGVSVSDAQQGATRGVGGRSGRAGGAKGDPTHKSGEKELVLCEELGKSVRECQVTPLLSTNENATHLLLGTGNKATKQKHFTLSHQQRFSAGREA